MCQTRNTSKRKELVIYVKTYNKHILNLDSKSKANHFHNLIEENELNHFKSWERARKIISITTKRSKKI